MKRVAIIGAGCSGLSAIKSCLADGLAPVCFEKGNDIGGLWNYSESVEIGRGSIYKNLIINTSKETIAFSDFPVPEHFPPFLPHYYVLKYFRMYAEKFGLTKRIYFNTSVRKIAKSADYDATGRWVVTYQRTGSGPPQEEVFDGVMVCTGHHTFPNVPHFHGIEDFRGTKMHSHSYKDSLRFRDKNVLIIGFGNSAVDIAVDVSRMASKVFLSTRKGAWIISRMGFWGIPQDLLANNRFLFSLPRKVLQWAVEKQANFRIDHSLFGVQPQHRVLEAHPTISDELPICVMSGKVTIKPNINGFFQNSVQFADDTVEEIDAVIYATGYDYRFDFVDETVLKIDNNQTKLYKYMFPPNLPYPTFAVIGLVQPIGSVIPVVEMQGRWFIQLMKGHVTLPSQAEMYSDIAAKSTEMSNTYVQSRRHTLQTFWIQYMDEIASKFGARPNLPKLFFKDPELALRCYLGPCIPAQYRIHGPGKWDGAKAIICNVIPRATKSRNVSHKKDGNKQLSREPRRPLMLVIYISVLLVVFLAWLWDSSPLNFCSDLFSR